MADAGQEKYSLFIRITAHGVRHWRGALDPLLGHGHQQPVADHRVWLGGQSDLWLVAAIAVVDAGGGQPVGRRRTRGMRASDGRGVATPTFALLAGPASATLAPVPVVPPVVMSHPAGLLREWYG